MNVKLDRTQFLSVRLPHCPELPNPSWQVLYCNAIEDTPVMRVLPTAWCEAVAKAPDDLFIPFSKSDKAIAVLDDREVIAFLAWTEERLPVIWITMGWVHPYHRKKGLYNKLWQFLVSEVRGMGVHAIFGSTGPDNTEMNAAMARQERKLVSNIYKFDLTKELHVK